MAAGGAGVSSPCFSPLRHRGIRRTTTTPPTFKRPLKISISLSSSVHTRQSVPATERTKSEAQPKAIRYNDSVDESDVVESLTLKDYFEQSKDMIRSNDGGPPRWFSPLECRSRSNDSPLLLFLPGIDGVGLGLVLHHQRLGHCVPSVMSSFSGIPLRMVMATVEKGLPLQQTDGEISQGVIALSSYLSGEEYKLFWPERSEFVRMAARFGATIIPFGAVGEDDFGQVFFDYDDQMKIPYFKNEIENRNQEAVQLRTDIDGEVANQDPHLPLILPKLPGLFYYLFGKPIVTEGRKQELKDREKTHELYLEVKCKVERCIAYLKEKRENDPYRNILPRLIYQATHGFDCEVPTLEL